MKVIDKREARHGLPWSEVSNRLGEVFEMLGSDAVGGTIVMVCRCGSGLDGVRAIDLNVGNRMCDTFEAHSRYTYLPVSARVVIGEEE